MKVGGPSEWSAIALTIASQLPQAEAFDFLSNALANAGLENSANFSQALGKTLHPNAAETIGKHLEMLWSHPALWEDDKFQNGIAFGAICSIRHLLELGEQPKQLDEKVKKLATHKCAGSRRTCKNFLQKYFPWLDTVGE
jgi:hypothetical protein